MKGFYCCRANFRECYFDKRTVVCISNRGVLSSASYHVLTGVLCSAASSQLDIRPSGHVEGYVLTRGDVTRLTSVAEHL